MAQSQQQAYVHKFDALRTDFGPSAHFDPWQLLTTDPTRVIDPYLSNGHTAVSVGIDGKIVRWAEAGRYKDGIIITHTLPKSAFPAPIATGYQQKLDLGTGVVTTHFLQGGRSMTRRVWVDRSAPVQHNSDQTDLLPISVHTEEQPNSTPDAFSSSPTLSFWHDSDIEIEGDPEADAQLLRPTLGQEETPIQ